MSTASATDFLTEYVEGFAQLLAAETDLAWQPAGDYPADEAGIFIGTVPASPDKLVALMPTPMDAHPVFTDSAVNLQIRFRAGADIRDTWAMRDQTRRVLAGRFPLLLPTGVYVSTLVFAYGTSMGQDSSKRWEWADNYRTRATEPRI